LLIAGQFLFFIGMCLFSKKLNKKDWDDSLLKVGIIDKSGKSQSFFEFQRIFSRVSFTIIGYGFLIIAPMCYIYKFVVDLIS
jgi:hypothetical protein